ncbi:gluconate 2-dehydrogenase subunit 3 family protein [Aureisphaera galaxeae]|uniref:gluconate 2-dehydrogenase subunit 3 family protein n=1 Tax=Aureisphaera galaxeae TaxID=1538023 RepID=UPI002350B7AF|nr:gluconate 2-dehydrogenase subunit 3 family protein [Aureisphaera galaxeae]MDC8005318.1 gluconate 2-dehydrogenase subunit 3 family protein [Aureisphaera galaxeae]
MDRRQALKSIGMGAGFLVATPTIMSLLQSCTSEPEFNPVFLSKGEGHALRRMVDLIIPDDEAVPGANKVGVHAFIDAFWNECMEEDDQTHVRNAWAVFTDQFKTTFEKEELEKGKPEEFDQLLAKYLKTDEETQMGYGRKIGEYYQAFDSDPTVKPDTDAAMFSLMANIRGMSMWAWKASEEIGKNVLWYDPVPGMQNGCITLGEAGNNGNAMAL